ncbi:MAG: hypothetical protein ACRCV9_11415 [Burkholderiaceae bacterium]
MSRLVICSAIAIVGLSACGGGGSSGAPGGGVGTPPPVAVDYKTAIAQQFVGSYPVTCNGTAATITVRADGSITVPGVTASLVAANGGVGGVAYFDLGSISRHELIFVDYAAKVYGSLTFNLDWTLRAASGGSTGQGIAPFACDAQGVSRPTATPNINALAQQIFNGSEGTLSCGFLATGQSGPGVTRSVPYKFNKDTLTLDGVNVSLTQNRVNESLDAGANADDVSYQVQYTAGGSIYVRKSASAPLKLSATTSLGLYSCGF